MTSHPYASQSDRFDFDGVIANSEPLHYQGFRDVLAQEGIALAENDYYARLLGFDDVGVFREVGKAQGAGWTPAQIGDLVARQAVELERLEGGASVLFDGAADAIRRAAAVVPIAIASGALGAEIRRVLDRENLTRFFLAIVSAEDTPASKPAPDPYLHAVAQLAKAIGMSLVPAECVAIEDSRWGCSRRPRASERWELRVPYGAELPAPTFTAHSDGAEY